MIPFIMKKNRVRLVIVHIVREEIVKWLNEIDSVK